jgi:sulfate permease, SulP family
MPDSPRLGQSLVSRLAPWIDEVDATTVRRDASAGLLGAVLVLPQGIAFASLAGLPPQMGLAAAVLPCIVAALAGSSRHVVSGPTNAHSLALGAMLAPLAVVGSTGYVQGALAVALMVGLLQVAVGVLRWGSVANFISPTALLGFTTGAALLIAAHALPSVLGHGPRAPWASLWQAAPSAAACTVAAITVAVAIVLRSRWPLGPHLLLALAAGTAAATLWGAVASRAGLAGPSAAMPLIGHVDVPWPSLTWPAEGLARWDELLGVAVALTVVGLAQSIAIARVMAERSGQRLDGNREFVGQGLGNLVAGCTGAMVICGSLNRSVPNLESGARTPLAAVTAGLLLIPLVAVAAPVLAWIPQAAIGALLLVVAGSLLDLPRWQRLVRSSRSEASVAALTLVATLALPLQVAVLVGSALSLGLYLHRTAHPAMRTMGFDRTGLDRPFVVRDDHPAPLPECPQIKLLRMEGSVYFAATAHVADHLQALRDAPNRQPHLLVMAKSMNFLDVAGAELWRHELAARRAMGGDLHFHRPRPPVVDQWRRDGFIEQLGADHLHADKRSAIRAICRNLDRSVCERCSVRVFEECWDPTVVAQPGHAATGSGA